MVVKRVGLTASRLVDGSGTRKGGGDIVGT